MTIFHDHAGGAGFRSKEPEVGRAGGSGAEEPGLRYTAEGVPGFISPENWHGLRVLPVLASVLVF